MADNNKVNQATPTGRQIVPRPNDGSVRPSNQRARLKRWWRGQPGVVQLLLIACVLFIVGGLYGCVLYGWGGALGRNRPVLHG
jgi:hypothetical protein